MRSRPADVQASPAAAVAARPRVLVVEADNRIAFLVARGLRRDGAEVVVAEDAEVGTFLASMEPFDVAIVDPGPRGGPGAELLRSIRAGSPSLPIIVLTEWDEPDGRAACLAVGVRVLLTKPFSLDELRAVVTATVHTRAGSATARSASAQLELT